MLEEFLDWVNEQLDTHGLARVLLGFITLLAAASALSVILGSRVVIGTVASSAMLIILVFLMAVVRGETRLRRVGSAAHALVQRYCDIVEELSHARLTVQDWEQVVELDEKGNAKVHRKITLTPQDARLHFLRLSLTYYGAPEQSLRLRRKVRAAARAVSGARWESSWIWRDDRTHQLLVHFRNPIDPGTPISIEAEWNWPLYSSELMQGGYEDFDIRFRHQVDRALHTVVMPLATRHGEMPSITSQMTDAKIEREGTRARITFEVIPCQENVRYGVRIDTRRIF